MLKTLAHALVTRGKITTTEAKAKELRPFIEKLVTLAKKEELGTRRLIVARAGPHTALKLLSTVAAKKYSNRKGGYTRIVKIGRRAKDTAKMAHIEFV